MRLPKNHIIKTIRISKEMDDLLNEAGNELGFKRQDLVRFLLNRALMQLKADSIKARGYKNLEITLREV